MMITALVIQESPTRLWGLSSGERIKRQLAQLGEFHWVSSVDQLADGGQVLLVNGQFLFEIRTLQGLLQKPNSILYSEIENKPAAALVDIGKAEEVIQHFIEHEEGRPASTPNVLNALSPAQLSSFNEALRSAQEPLLELVSEERRNDLENLLYGNAYRGITDLVTKFLWPRPARKLVHWCAAAGLTPNMVTSIGFVLVLAACYWFLNGQYWAGLAAGWVMTLLDTVDGKLARVTIQSSQFGHLFDHGIDLLHPPFWYIFWGMSLSALPTMMGLDFNAMCWLLIAAYVLGRVIEGLFPLLGQCSIFTWRPFDAWFRLVTARRNPCLIILTLSLLLGHPDWGFIAVVLWSAATSGVLVLRFFHGLIIRLSKGPLNSWLSEIDVASGENATSFRVFGATRGAYGK